MINPKEKMLDQLKSQAVPFSAADETDIVAVAMAFGEEIQKHGDPAMAIYALKQQLADAQAKLAAVERDAVGLLKAEYYRGYSDREQEVRDGIGAYGHPIKENIKENERLERENEELRYAIADLASLFWKTSKHCR